MKQFFLLIYIINSLFVFSQSDKPFIQNFTSKQYGTSFNAQNWSVCLDSNNTLYFGNYNSVLQYDGDSWKAYNVGTNSGYIVSLLYYHNKIFVGGNNVFGYLNKQKQFVSLSDSISGKFGVVWRIFQQNDKIIFFTQKALFILNKGKIEKIAPLGSDKNKSFHLAFKSNNQIFVRQRNVGLLELKNNKLNEILDYELFKEIGIFGIHKISNNKYILITQEKGLFLMIRSSTGYLVTQLYTSDTEELNSLKILGSIKLNDGNIALNTATSGIIIINKDGKIIQHISEKFGLINNDVKQILQTPDNDIWAVTGNGISRINYDSPISFYDERYGLPGNVFKTIKFNKNIFVATGTGLFKVNNNRTLGFFDKLNLINNSVFSIEKSENNMYVGTNDNLWQIDTSFNIKKLTTGNFMKIKWIPEKNIIVAGGLNGIYIYKENKTLKLQQAIPELASNITGIEYSADNDSNIVIWVTTLKSGVFKLTQKNNLQFDYEFFYGKDDGLNNSWTKVFKYNGELFFSNSNGTLKFLSIKDLQKDLPDSLKHDISKGYFSYSNIFKNSQVSITAFAYDSTNILAYIDGKLMIKNKKTKSFSQNIFSNIELLNCNDLNIVDTKTLLISTNDGLYKYNLNKTNYTKTKPDIFLRKIISENDTILLDSISNYNVLNYDYSKNNIEIYYSSLYLKDGKKPEYSYKIDGLDKKWSKWTSDNNLTLKHLHDGNYTIKIKARTRFGVESKTSEIYFSILPPWYKTVWAYLLFIVISVLLIALIIKLYTARLKAQNAELERIVKERTKQIRKQKDEIEKIHHELKDSIIYAEKIQKAVLPSNKVIENCVSDYFIFFKPKDIVSGDFYWATCVDSKFVITVADCTGHGVPGAFMSMLGVSFLNEIVNNDKILQAGDILNTLRQKVIKAMQQRGVEGEQKDGMDISICVIDTKTLQMEWAGANNPLYVIKNKELKISNNENSIIKLCDNSKLKIQNSKLLYEVKPNKMPIAIYIKMEPFTSNKIQLEKGDNLYMFSDGFADQFGGPKGKKFKYKPFKRLLLNNAEKSMEEQYKIIEKTFYDWKGELEQVDDVTVVGIKL